jgi:hypothetical protein
MTTQHSLDMLLGDDVTDDQCRELIITHMLSMFPDAVVDGPPVVTSGSSVRSVRVSFVSPMFDLVATKMLNIIDNEFKSFILWINDSRLLTQEDKAAYILLVDAMASRVNAIFGTDKEQSHDS